MFTISNQADKAVYYVLTLLSWKSGCEERKSRMKLYSRAGTLYLTYYHGFDRVRKSTGLPDTKENRKFIENKIIPELLFELKYGQKEKEKVIPQFDHYADIYLSEKRNRLKEHTFIKYSRILKNEIIPFFGGQQIDQIKVTDVRIWVNKQLERIVPKTVAEKLIVLRSVFRYAFEDEVIVRNPVDAIRLPARSKPDIEPFTVEEVGLILNGSEDWYRNYLAFAFYTGMRIGEILALKWSDIDMNKRKIHVRRSISQGLETSPKTIGSVRVMPISDILWTYLQDQYRYTGLAGEYIFVSKVTGSAFNDATSLRQARWIPLLKRLGIPYRQQKNTRHTFAVQMLNSGTMKIMDISRLMGHNSTQMLLTRYAKFIKSEEIKIEETFDLFGLKTGTSKKEVIGEVRNIG
jgi:integrase